MGTKWVFDFKIVEIELEYEFLKSSDIWLLISSHHHYFSINSTENFEIIFISHFSIKGTFI